MPAGTTWNGNTSWITADGKGDVIVLVRTAPGTSTAPAEPTALGDLAICAAVVAREAAEQGKAAKAHWAHMVVHGCLHLRGYDHMNASEARVMETRERQLLAGLGIADPYAV